MSEWTETARRTLDEYCSRAKAAVAGTGADADEVIDDLRRHVEEEVRAARLTVVTEDDIQHILARIGEPGAAIEKKSGAQPPPYASADKEKKKPGYILLVLGVVLPLGTLIFELVTGISAGVLFDPLPNWLHVLAIALVPAANLWIWRAGRARDSRHANLLGWVNGIALGICFYYVVLYLPFIPIAAIAVVYFGLGLIPLTPLIALMATPLLRGSYGRRIDREKLPGAWWGPVAGVAFLVLLQVPAALTYYGLARASSEDPNTRMRGVRLLRSFGDRELILRACYGGLQRNRDFNFDLIRALASGDQRITAEQARETYYRVTGKPFNSVPPPSLYTRMGRWSALDEEFTWDDAVGGEAVAGRVRGLSLLSSRMDAVAEPDAALVYCEWTLEFRNVSSQPREARAQIALPPGGVVSHLTLWIDGEEREAAFGGRSQTRQAYQEVAVVRRRDPVLVTTCGPDRVLAQCFPVPPDGGVMKVRIGITAPLILESLQQGRFVWPGFVERNFAVAADFQHGLSIESPSLLASEDGAVTAAKSNSHPFILRETESEFADWSKAAVTVHRSSDITSTWAPAEGNGEVIRQTIRSIAPSAPPRIVLLVDGSAGMRSLIPEIADVLSEVSSGTEIAVVVSGDDGPLWQSRPKPAEASTVADIRRSLPRLSFAGGRDNLPALEVAWNLAAPVENGVVIWVHGPQPVLLSPESLLRQAIERTVTHTRVFEIQTHSGPDRIIEKLDGVSAIQHVPRLGSLRADLTGLLAQWNGRKPRFEFARERIAASPETAVGARASKHLERLWARDEALRLAAKRQREAATQLAAAEQLVTPLTGAVVLETQQQFTQHGLTPADAANVPAVPEPQIGSLVGVGILIWLTRRFRKRARR